MRFRQSIIPTVTPLIVSMGFFCGAEAKTIEAGHATVSWKGMGVIEDLGDGDRAFNGTLTGTLVTGRSSVCGESDRFYDDSLLTEIPGASEYDLSQAFESAKKV